MKRLPRSKLQTYLHFTYFYHFMHYGFVLHFVWAIKKFSYWQMEFFSIFLLPGPLLVFNIFPGILNPLLFLHTMNINHLFAFKY